MHIRQVGTHFWMLWHTQLPGAISMSLPYTADWPEEVEHMARWVSMDEDGHQIQAAFSSFTVLLE